MRSFTYQAPTSIDEAIATMVGHPKTHLMAGGTDLLVQLRRGLADADCVIDVKGIPELTAISLDPDGSLTIGAAVSCARLCENADVRRAHPGLIDAVSIIGGAAIQGRATVGGNLCNAAPSADTIPPLIVLRATCTVSGPQGARSVPVEAFCTAPGKTVLAPSEILISISVPPAQHHSGACYLRFTPRHEMDIAVVGAAAWLKLAADNATIADARVALSAVAPTPLFVRAAGDSLLGRAPSEDAFALAAGLAQEAARPIGDVRGTAVQRRHLVGVLVRRALHGALGRARGLNRDVPEGG
jgi:CO/xanthine dehydrogenase FAD-binding subunit